MKKLLLLGLFIQLEAYDFNFEQMKEDAERIKASEYRYNFDFENPKHKYFVVINALDVDTTIYAMENRNTLAEANYLLPAKPELEELIIQKTIVLYSLYHLGLFSEYPEDQWYINTMNITLTAAVLSNLYHINTNE